MATTVRVNASLAGTISTNAISTYNYRSDGGQLQAGLTGSNAVATYTYINTGSFIPIGTGSCASVSYIYMKNEETASFYFDIANNNNTSNVFARLDPQDFLLLPASGSQKQYYAYAKGSRKSGSLQVVMFEN